MVVFSMVVVHCTMLPAISWPTVRAARQRSRARVLPDGAYAAGPRTLLLQMPLRIAPTNVANDPLLRLQLVLLLNRLRGHEHAPATAAAHRPRPRTLL